ncbi:MAG: SDR family oxidoreductase, partial [Candidatus Thorarchaeota archaeon]|nr:SDR family oxidoreductase [Candidatus Thorarchaeota archaeon]
MRLLLTGAAGMLGSSLVPVLKDAGHSVYTTDINYLDEMDQKLDVRDLGEMLQVSDVVGPELFVHLAAETNLEVCENDPDYAYRENFIGTQNACVVCRKLGIPLVYISTAGVFDGLKSGPYTEFDQPNPINIYGDSKYCGELTIRETLPEHYIIRAGWMVGGGDRDKKFVHKIIEQIENGAKEINVVTDKLGTPTYAPAFSKVLERLMRSELYGTYHLACKGKASRFDVAAEILKILNRPD